MGNIYDCDKCTFFVCDDETGEYECLVNLDEDEYCALISGRYRKCPYFREDDEYGIVRKQM